MPFRRIAKYFALVILSLPFVKLAIAQSAGATASKNGYLPNATSVTNNATATQGPPVPFQGILPSGQAITENGLQPGAQLNVIIVDEGGGLAQIDDAEQAITQDVAQAWPGVPYVQYPAPTFTILTEAPAVSTSTGWQGSSTDNVTAVLYSVTQTFMEDNFPGIAGATANTNDPDSGYTSSSLSFISYSQVPPDDPGPVTGHEFGHGIFNLTDTNGNPPSLMTGQVDAPGWSKTGFTAADKATLSTDFIDPTPPPDPPPPPPCN